MRKLAALIVHILNVTSLPEEQIVGWAEGGSVHPMGRDRGPRRPEPGEEGEIRQQVELGLFRYDGVILVERYPGDGNDFTAMLAAWLADHDPDRDDQGLEKDMDLDITLNIRGGDCDVQLAIEFEERLEAIEDPDGNIPFNGKKWRLAPAVITPVTALAGMNATNKGADTCP